MAESSLLTVDRLGKQYGVGQAAVLQQAAPQQTESPAAGFWALRDCSFMVPAGEVLGVLGPNGAGKTTLLRLLLGFLQPTTGSATLAGLDCYRERIAVHRQLAYLPGEAHLFPNMRGREVLRFLASVHPRRDFQRSLQLADRLEVDLSRRIAKCSTGMKQKVALAAILATDVPVIVLDEATANLDPSVRREVLALVREAKEAGRTVLFSSHVHAETEAVCDRVIILRAGSLVHTQVIADLRRQHRLRAHLLGPMPTVPAALADLVQVQRTPLRDASGVEELTITSAADLASLLGWLAELRLDEVRIEPVGLATVYDRFHHPEDSD